MFGVDHYPPLGIVLDEKPTNVFATGGSRILSLSDTDVLRRSGQGGGEGGVEMHTVTAPRQCAGIDHRPGHLSGRGAGFCLLTDMGTHDDEDYVLP